MCSGWVTGSEISDVYLAWLRNRIIGSRTKVSLTGKTENWKRRAEEVVLSSLRFRGNSDELFD
jgi:hypothetical protein